LEFQLRPRAICFNLGLVGAAMLTAASVANAQFDGSRWSMPAGAGGRHAVAAPARTVVQRQPSYFYPGYYGGGYSYGAGYYGGYYYRQPYIVSSDYTVNYNVHIVDDRYTNQQVFLFPSPQYRTFVPQPVAYSLIPAYSLPDGTVLADFGMGLEPVRRFCGDQFVLDGGAPPPPATSRNTQPAPSQSTQSAQNANAQRYPVLTTASQGACYTQDRYGRFFAVR